MVTGCRSKRSELPFSAAYNLFWNFCLSNGSEGASGWQLLHMGLENAVLLQMKPQNRLFLSTLTNDKPGCFNLSLLLMLWLLKNGESNGDWEWNQTFLNTYSGGWVHVTNGPKERVEHVKSVAINICDSCSSWLFKSKTETLLKSSFALFSMFWVCFFNSSIRFGEWIKSVLTQ